MKTPSVHSKKPQEALELKAIIASLLDQARDKVSFVDRDDPDCRLCGGIDFGSKTPKSGEWLRGWCHWDISCI